MYFKLHYFRNPVARAKPWNTQHGMRLLNRGLHNIKLKIMHPRRRLNPSRNAKRAIHGLAYLYGFRYRSFLQDNFVKKYKYLYCDGKRCQLSNWAVILAYLNAEVRAINSCQNISTLLRSRYAKYIHIDGIRHYYHPRKKHYVKNARNKLAELGDNQRYHFLGTFQRFGSKPNGQLTVLLTDIKYKGRMLTDHIWFNATKGFRLLGHLTAGEKISFVGRIAKYKKGYLPDTFTKHYDYKIKYPTQIRKEHSREIK